jgi:hypothetical protein
MMLWQVARGSGCPVPSTHHFRLGPRRNPAVAATRPPSHRTLAVERAPLEKIAGVLAPTSFSSDKDALLVGTGRRAPTDPELLRASL